MKNSFLMHTCVIRQRHFSNIKPLVIIVLTTRQLWISEQSIRIYFFIHAKFIITFIITLISFSTTLFVLRCIIRLVPIIFLHSHVSIASSLFLSNFAMASAFHNHTTQRSKCMFFRFIFSCILERLSIGNIGVISGGGGLKNSKK